MTEAEPREPPRQVGHFLLLVLVAFVVFLSAVLSARPVLLANFNNVAPAAFGAAAPDNGDDWSVVIHRSDWKAPIAALLGRADRRRPRLGWVVSEWSFLSLPLIAFRQSEVAAFREDGYGYQLSGLSDGQRAAIDRAGGAGWFPFWRFCWGWLAIAAAAAFAWAELRCQARRRALLGIF